MTTAAWGPMGRVRSRQLAQRVEDTQRGTEWVVRRVKLVTLRKCWKVEYTPVVIELGSVYADNRGDAERKAIETYGDGVTVQSAISSRLAQEETESLMRGRKQRPGRRYG